MQFQNPFSTLFHFCYVAIFSCVNLLSAETVQINDGYDSGVIVVDNPFWVEEFTFSNGLSLKTFDLKDPFHMGYYHLMGYFCDDTAYEIPFDSDKEMPLWEDVTAVPDELTVCAIPRYFVDSTASIEQSDQVPGICRFWRNGTYNTFDELICTEDSFLQMFFILTPDGRNFKFEVYNQKFYKSIEGPNDDIAISIYEYSLRWAVDSAGDGKFKHNAAVVHANQSKVNTPYTYSLLQKTLFFEMKSAQSFELSLYSLNGQVLKRMQESGVTLPLHDLAKGAYILRIKSAGQLFTEKLFIP